MIGDSFWSCGISVRFVEGAWLARAEFHDAGFCEAGSARGVVELTYAMEDLFEAVATVKADVERLQITWFDPHVFAHADGTDEASPMPAGWRALLNEVATTHGWQGPSVVLPEDAVVLNAMAQAPLSQRSSSMSVDDLLFDIGVAEPPTH